MQTRIHGVIVRSAMIAGVSMMIAACTGGDNADIRYKPSMRQLEALPHTHKPRPETFGGVPDRVEKPYVMQSMELHTLAAGDWGCQRGAQFAGVYRFGLDGTLRVENASGARSGRFSINGSTVLLDPAAGGGRYRMVVGQSDNLLFLNSDAREQSLRCFYRASTGYLAADPNLAGTAAAVGGVWRCAAAGEVSIDGSRSAVGGRTGSAVFWSDGATVGFALLAEAAPNGVFVSVDDYEIEIDRVRDGRLRLRKFSSGNWEDCGRAGVSG